MIGIRVLIQYNLILGSSREKNRLCKTPHVLPREISKLWETDQEHVAEQYASARIMKLNNKEVYAERFNQIKNVAFCNP